jgi:large subunit ribosomal protein L10
LAISKERKNEWIDRYVDWLGRSQALILTDYCGHSTKSLYQLRSRVREAQGEFHVVKNTLIVRALRQVDMLVPEPLLDGPTAVIFCFGELPTIAKPVVQFAEEVKTFTIKGALLGSEIIDAAGVKALSALPPRPIVMAQLLGVIQAPASQVTGAVHAGLRQVAAVIQARVDQLKAVEEAAA